MSKWALLWKSIIRSSLGATAYPYCLYIRSLYLQNLDSLLKDSQFPAIALDTFFADGMDVFFRGQGTTTWPIPKKTRSAKTNSYVRLNVAGIIDIVGDSITKYVADSEHRDQTTVLDELSGEIGSAALQKWSGRVSRLKTLTLFDGSVLNEGLADTINKYCPGFDDLTFHHFLQGDAAPNLSAFFSTLRPNSLRSFTALSARNIWPDVFMTLNNHRLSLKVLKLDGLKSDAIKRLSLFQGCEALEILHLQDEDGVIDLEKTENDVYLEVLEWLGRCSQLRELSLKKILSAPSILANLCLRNNIRLRSLEVTRYPMLTGSDFHRAISHQTSLESLILRADYHDIISREHTDRLVSSICKLAGLKELDICETSDYFESSEIMQLASCLPKLERFSFSGQEVTDAIWPSIASLHRLQAFNAHATTCFSFGGLLSYISTLQPTNHGLVLSVLSQRLDWNLSAHHRDILQHKIAEKVDGRFEFVLYRDSDSEYDSASD